MECPNQIEDEECLCSDMEVGNQDKRQTCWGFFCIIMNIQTAIPQEL